jgi:hypothetical protein
MPFRESLQRTGCRLREASNARELPVVTDADFLRTSVRL